MRLLVLHLSDFHFDAKMKNEAVYRAGNVVQAALGNVPGVEKVLVVATGDFVDRAEVEAYELASIFFSDLRAEISRFDERVGLEDVIVLPGNHDTVRPHDEEAEYDLGNATRDLLKAPYPVDPSGILVRKCLKQQDAYFKFARSVSGRPYADGESKLASVFVYALQGLTIRVVALNTAWMCRGSADQGRLLAWCPSLDGSEESCVFQIFALHHPFSWLVRENAKPLERLVSRTADLVLSGHEHESDDFVRHHKGGHSSAFFEGDALSGPKGAFAALVIDTETMSRKTYPFLWDGEAYVPMDEREWEPLRRGVGGPSDGLLFTEEFEEFLEDAGMPASKSGARVRLNDVFIYPKLRDITLEARSTGGAKGRKPAHDQSYPQGRGSNDGGKMRTALDTAMNASEILGQLATNKRILLVGDTRSGKSTLLKKYCVELRAMGMVPLILKPSDCEGLSADAVMSAIRRRAEEQYGPDSVQKFLQSPLNKRVILIDELHSLPLSSPQLSELLMTLSSLSEHAILTADELYVVRQIWALIDKPETPEYRVYRLLELDPRQRKELAAKMQAALTAQGAEHEIGDSLNWLDQSVTAVLGEHIITPSVGEVKAVIGAFLLQPNGGTTQGAFGFYYDTQIKNDIAAGLGSCPKDVLEPQADAIEAFLSKLAMLLHEKGSIYASEQDIDGLIRWFRDEKIEIDKRALKLILKAARLVVEKDDGYCFRERYQRYYFMARNLERMLGSEETFEPAREILRGLVATIHERESADVVLFTVYLTNSQWLLRMVAERSDAIFAEESQCDMRDDFGFVQASYDQVKALAERPPEEAQEGAGAIVPQRSGAEREDLLADTVKTMSEAFNVLTILGLAVRNYPAKIDLPLRTKMVENGYGLSLRSLSAFLRLIKEGREGLDILAQRHLKLRIAEDGGENLALQLTSLCSFGIIRRTVQAFASPHLQLLLTDVWKGDDRVSARMVRFGTLLDLRKMGTYDAGKLHEEFEDNPTADLVLKYVVANHLRVFRATRDRRVPLCLAVDIDPDNPAYFYDRARPKAIGRDT